MKSLDTGPSPLKGERAEEPARNRDPNASVPSAKEVGEFLLRHVAGLLALGAVTLYGVGLLRRIGQLNTDHIETVRALPLSPLQDYFLSGLSVVLSFGFMAVVLAVGIASYAAHSGLQSSRKGGSKMQNQWLSDQKWIRRGLVVAYPTFMVILVVMTPVRYWAPMVGLGFVLVGAAIFLAHRGVIPESADDLSPPQLRVATVMIGVVLLIAFGAQAYFNPPPLDHVTLHMTSGRSIDGKLVTQGSGFVYLAHGFQEQKEATASITAVPSEQIRQMRITDGETRHFETLPEAVGVHLWRLELSGSEPLIERSR